MQANVYTYFIGKSDNEWKDTVDYLLELGRKKATPSLRYFRIPKKFLPYLSSLSLSAKSTRNTEQY
jgi:hypothetical protein